MSQPQRSDPHPQAAHGPCAPTMFLMVGLPGAGKTTRARELAAASRALRLTPDHWMKPLFGGDGMAGGLRFTLEGRLISVALQALRLGTSVVLDFGLWGRDERWALHWLARSAGAACQVPDAAELGGGEIPGPPAGWPGWLEWAVHHWPTCTES